MKRKMASTKGFPLAMMVIAFLLSAVCAAQEFIALFIYKKAFDPPVYKYVLMEKTSDYFVKYSPAIFVFVFTFFAMLTFFAGVGKKTCGYKEGVLVMFAGVAAAVAPVFKFLYFLGSDSFDALSSSDDGAKFRAANEMISYCGPVFVCFLLVLAGFGLIIKVKASKVFAVISDPNTEAEEAPSPAVSAEPIAVAASVLPVEEPVPVAVELPTEEAAPEIAAEAVAEAAESGTEDAGVGVIPEAAHQTEEAPAQIKCVSCGETLAAGVKFCRHCGAKQE